MKVTVVLACLLALALLSCESSTNNGGDVAPRTANRASTVRGFGQGPTASQAKKAAWDDAMARAARLGWKRFSVDDAGEGHGTVNGVHQSAVTLVVTPDESAETLAYPAVTDSPPGRLGHPIGTYLRIECYREASKNPETYRVVRVNDRELEESRHVWIENLALPRVESGVRCIINGYERIEWMGEPAEVSRAEGRDGSQLVFQPVFLFHATSIIEPAELKLR